jgi:hypothetical protein
MKKIDNFVFSNFRNSTEYGEPQLLHSFILSAANIFKHLAGNTDPVWLMGSSAFAFRIFVEETLSPNAMSMFEFSNILPEVIKQSGRGCIYIHRTIDEKELEEKKRTEAHTAIVKELDRNIPAIVWDIYKAEWGIIIGYNDQEKIYYCLSDEGEEIILSYNKLGMNGIDLLSIVIPGKRNERKKENVIANSLRAAVKHADGKEWIDKRPRCQNGIEAYQLWITIFERWAWLIESGKIENPKTGFVKRAKYYADYHYYARYYAQKYLAQIAGSDIYLIHALDSYKRVVENLRQLWIYFNNVSKPRSDDLLLLTGSLRSAKDSEEEGIEYIRKYLSHLSLNNND